MGNPHTSKLFSSTVNLHLYFPHYMPFSGVHDKLFQHM